MQRDAKLFQIDGFSAVGCRSILSQLERGPVGTGKTPDVVSRLLDLLPGCPWKAEDEVSGACDLELIACPKDLQVLDCRGVSAEPAQVGVCQAIEADDNRGAAGFPEMEQLSGADTGRYCAQKAEIFSTLLRNL